MTASAGPGAAQSGHYAKGPEEASQRRFREVHYHRFVLGSRSNVHGACLLRSRLPVRLPRPHTMQLRYDHPPPGVGYRRLAVPDWGVDIDQATYERMVLEHRRSALAQIGDECEKTAKCIAANKDVVRAHVAVATQSGLLFFVAGFGYWNVLDIDLKLKNESCVGVKVFETMVDEAEAEAEDKDADSSEEAQAGSGTEADAETKDRPVADEHEHEHEPAQRAKGLPVMVIALTTYVKGPAADGKKPDGGGAGTYRLYALGAESLPAVPQDFIDKHAIKTAGVKIGPKQSAKGGTAAGTASRAKSGPADNSPTNSDMAASLAAVDIARSKSLPSQLEPGSLQAASLGLSSGSDAAASAFASSPASEKTTLSINSYAFLEERLFGLQVSDLTAGVELAYLPFRISQDVVQGMPPLLLVAGNDSRVHRYAVGCNGLFEIEPLLCPKTDIDRTFTAFDGRVVGPYHVQITAHQEFAVALQVSQTLGDGSARRRLLVADEEVYDAAPILATIFSPEVGQRDRTAFDYAITELVSSSKASKEKPIVAGDVYDSVWPVGDVGSAMSSEDAMPRVHALVGFVGEDAVVYHDVPVAGLDPVPTLVGGVACRVPESASHISGRLGGMGGIFSLPGSAKEGLITSVHFDDLDFNGTKEIIVGTVSGA
ncbi:hypothetical protein LPJ56_002188, partial [Coemansia sp. RSA 2599]